MSNGNLSLLIDVREERPLVVDAEVEDAMLIGEFETRAVNGGVLGGLDRDEGEAVERREHCEFELQSVVLWGGEGDPMRVGVFGEGDGEGDVVFDSVYRWVELRNGIV